MNAATNRTNLNSLSLDEKQTLVKSIYEGTSYFQELFHRDQIEIKATAIATLLREEITRLLFDKHLVQELSVLENLHDVLTDEMKAYNFDDGVSKISTSFYETDAKFMDVYMQFIQFLRNDLLKEPFWFQATPTIRIHCPNAINRHHYPRYHSDISYGHPPEEMNIWVPLTELKAGHGFSALDVKTSHDILKDFNYDFAKLIHSAIHDKAFSTQCDAISSAVNTPFGHLFAFDSRCIHSGQPLKFHTRISMDIRILPLSQYEKMEIEYQGSGRRKILFIPGHCYHLHHSDQF